MGARRWLMLALLVLVSAFALTASHGVAPALGPRPAARPAAQPVAAATVCATQPGRTVGVSFAVERQGARSALIHLPRRHRGRLPLVLALHGAFGNGAFMERYSGLSRLAEREGFAVVYPDAAGPRWRIAADENGADAEFLDALLDRLLAGGCFDERRISAVGVSNGAGMAARFACTGEDRLAGVVAVAGGYGSLGACRAGRPLSLMEIHGTADAVVPYRGKPGDRRGDVLRWVGAWADHNDCPRTPRRRTLRPRVERLDWTPCRAGTSVAHLRLDGGTHAWPGADPPDPGPELGISASEEAWSFLRRKRVSAAVAEHRNG